MFYIGVDIGTTSTKAVLFTQETKVHCVSHVEYPLHSPLPMIAEQDPEEIFQAVVKAIKDVVEKSGAGPDEIRFVSFSSAMHSIIAVDGSGIPITPCITWADSRSKAWADKIKDEMNGHDIYMRTGTPIHPMSPLAKIAWLTHDCPEVIEAAYKFISIKEYVFHKLFSQFVIDHSLASATGLFSLADLDWDEEALRTAGITRERLSRPVPTTWHTTGMKEQYAREMGLSVRTIFIIGASDGVLSNLGVNAIDPGIVAVTIGTSGAIRTVTDRPVTDEKGRIFCYALTDKHWVIGGPVNNGGMTFRWLRDELASAEVETVRRLGIDSYEVLTKIAERVMPGAEGLLFHPYLAGERAPLWNPDARGSFFGLGMHHKKEHMVRAVLEGVIFNLYTVLLALQELIGVPEKIKATGGFARSHLWRQMLADIFNQEVEIPESFESSCLGAVVLGRYALGEIKDFSSVKNLVGTTHIHTPNEQNVQIYEELIPIYISIYRKLEQEYGSIAAFQNKWANKVFE